MKIHPILFLAILLTAKIPHANAAAPRHFYTDTLHSVPVPAVDNMLAQILSVTGLKANFELKSANVRNIEAIVSHRKRLILYNAAFIDRINKAGGDQWCTMALLAHEVGHHLNGHTIRKGGSSPALELEADEFAGFVLERLGASLEQAQHVMTFIASETASSTHPAKVDRLNAIQKGWDRANTQTQSVARAR